MKLGLNQRSAEELLKIMEALDHKSPTHTAQVLISHYLKNLNTLPIVEEPINATTLQNLPPLQG